MTNIESALSILVVLSLMINAALFWRANSHEKLLMLLIKELDL